MTMTEGDESALNVANGYLYATLSGFAHDTPPYVGHVVAVNLLTGARTIFNALCSQDRGLLGPSSCPQLRAGIWARGGAVVDADASMGGRIYVTTGNGEFDANRAGGQDYGDSVLALPPDLSELLGNYTPTNYKYLGHHDLDMGSSSPALLPAQPASQTPLMLVQGGKDSVLRLIDRSPLSGVGGALQVFGLPAALFGTPAVWTDPSNDTWVFLGLPNVVQAYRLQTNASGISRLAGIWQNKAGSTIEGTSPVVADGIVFVAFDGAIIALNALTGTELWSSAVRTAGKTIGSVHWQSPIVVDGWVYCSDHGGNLTAYTLR
jgi:outer membrane protein assembly factor BamB